MIRDVVSCGLLPHILKEALPGNGSGLYFPRRLRKASVSAGTMAYKSPTTP